MNLEQALDYRDTYEAKTKDAAAHIRVRMKQKPAFGIVLGSGLGDLANQIEDQIVIPYDEIRGFPKTTVPGHEGKVIIGNLEGVWVVGLKGRKHFYEVSDDPMNTGILQTVFPVHVLANLDIPNYFVTNAAGGLNPNYNVGDIMVINSHINMLPNPLAGRHHDFTRVDNGQRVERFQPMNGAYDQFMSLMLRRAGEIKAEGHNHQGKYLAVTGPTYETEGECIAFRDGFKADAVGMSTTPEVIVARNRGMNVVGFSCITNKIGPDGTNATNHDEVKRVLESSEVKDRMTATVRTFFRAYAKAEATIKANY